jgi:hypothetical protein
LTQPGINNDVSISVYPLSASFMEGDGFIASYNAGASWNKRDLDNVEITEIRLKYLRRHKYSIKSTENC